MGIFRWFAGLAIVAGCVVELGGGCAQAAEPSDTAGRKVICRVNDQPIYEDQLQPEVEKTLGDLRRRGGRATDPQVVSRLQMRLLDKAIGDVLVNQESKKRTIENMDEKVEQRVKDLEKKHGAGEGMERYLKIRKITLAELKESLKGRVRVDEYLKEQGVLDPEIPEERIRAMYDEDPQSFSSRETAKVSHILIAVDAQAGPEAKEQARKKAEQVRKEILEGADFAEMAKKNSSCWSAPRGGDLGTRKRGDMPVEFDKVAFALEKDAVSEVVETRFGFHIIKLAEKTPAVVVPYEQMREFLKKYLQEEESKKKLAEHVAELKKKSKIEILLK
ncbi:MAG: peptidylprolyl isomerase [Pirellulaceae bacterium]|nr:peptidylprolyl isomerase [Pirellulaceae bacterium]